MANRFITLDNLELFKSLVAVQYIQLPAASAGLVGKICQYIGPATVNYTTGYFYQCVDNSGVYSWQAISVSSGSGGDISGQTFIIHYDYTTNTFTEDTATIIDIIENTERPVVLAVRWAAGGEYLYYLQQELRNIFSITAPATFSSTFYSAASIYCLDSVSLNIDGTTITVVGTDDVGEISNTPLNSAINFDDVFINRNVLTGEINSLLATLPYSEALVTPLGDITCKTSLATCDIRGYTLADPNEIDALNYPLLFAVDNSVLGTAVSIPGCSGYSLMTGDGVPELIYVSVDTSANRLLALNLLNTVITSAGFQVDSFNVITHANSATSTINDTITPGYATHFSAIPAYRGLIAAILTPYSAKVLNADSVPIQNSINYLTSGGAYNSFSTKQDLLTISSINDGTLDRNNIIGFDSQGNLVKGTASGGTQLYIHTLLLRDSNEVLPALTLRVWNNNNTAITDYSVDFLSFAIVKEVIANNTVQTILSCNTSSGIINYFKASDGSINTVNFLDYDTITEIDQQPY